MSRLRSLTLPSLVLLLSSAALAGCIGDGGGDDDDAASNVFHIPAGGDLEDLQPFALFLCNDGYRVAEDAVQQAASGQTLTNSTALVIGQRAGLNISANLPVPVDRCNHRVTKPLANPDTLDVVNQHGPANEVSIAINPTDWLNAAGGAKDYTVSYVSDHAECGEYTVWMGQYWTYDAGLTWGNDLMKGFPDDPRPSPLAGNLCNTDPVLVYDDDGTLWFNGLNYRGTREDQATAPGPYGSDDATTGSQLYFAKSDDGGATYGDITFASVGDNQAVFNDKQWFAVQPGGDHMIVTWTNFVSPLAGAPVPGTGTPADAATFLPGGVIQYSESLDGGATWTPPRNMNMGTVATNTFVQDSMPQYFNDGQNVAVTWISVTPDANDQLQSVVAYNEGAILPDGAVAFEQGRAAFPYNPVGSDPGRDGSGPSKFRWGTIPVLAIDTSGGEHNGRRYVVYEDQPGEVNTDVNVLLRYSDAANGPWSDPIVVSDTEIGDQLLPWIETDEEGGVHVMFYDRRNDAENRLLDVYYAYSDDGGQSFHPNVRVTETSFDGDLAHHQNGSPFIGDYNGMDATSKHVILMWADTRHTGEPGREKGSDVYTATLFRDINAREQFDEALVMQGLVAPDS